MYIEFDLPAGSATAGAWGMINQWLDQALEDWANRYEIEYRTKNVKYKKRVTFDDERCYEFFLLTWNPTNQQNFWQSFRLVTDLNNKI
jgi:hypothetical protein